MSDTSTVTHRIELVTPHATIVQRADAEWAARTVLNDRAIVRTSSANGNVWRVTFGTRAEVKPLLAEAVNAARQYAPLADLVIWGRH